MCTHFVLRCAMDIVPRKWDAGCASMLSNMAEMAVREIERDALLKQMDSHTSEMTSVNSSLVRAVETFRCGCETHLSDSSVILLCETLESDSFLILICETLVRFRHVCFWRLCGTCL